MTTIQLEKPKYGWSQLHIGDWHGDLSYVDASPCKNERSSR